MTNHTAPPIVPHLQTLHAVLNSWATRTSVNGMGAANLIPCAMNPQTGLELLQLQTAILDKLWRQQQDSWRGWTAWTQECAQIRRANTVSKLVEQDLNLVVQLGQLMSDQTTDLVGMLENFGFNYDYWLSEKLNPPAGPPAVR
jgi:hypothetical protein